MNRAELLEVMRTNWYALLHNFSVNGEVADAMFEDLVAHYGGEGRYYHNLAHIHNMLGTIDGMRDLAEDMAAIQLAAWYHDVIYEMGASDNEAKSAEYAEKALSRAGIPGETIAAVKQMILATEIHRAPPNHKDCKILVDADLSTLASPQETYDKNARAIRQEFAYVPDSVYRSSRKVILNQFLERERIFLTDHMYEQLEQKARENIKREIASLS